MLNIKKQKNSIYNNKNVYCIKYNNNFVYYKWTFRLLPKFSTHTYETNLTYTKHHIFYGSNRYLKYLNRYLFSRVSTAASSVIPKNNFENNLQVHLLETKKKCKHEKQVI